MVTVSVFVQHPGDFLQVTPTINGHQSVGTIIYDAATGLPTATLGIITANGDYFFFTEGCDTVSFSAPAIPNTQPIIIWAAASRACRRAETPVKNFLQPVITRFTADGAPAAIQVSGDQGQCVVQAVSQGGRATTYTCQQQISLDGINFINNGASFSQLDEANIRILPVATYAFYRFVVTGTVLGPATAVNIYSVTR
jgi:hypothetical protein